MTFMVHTDDIQVNEHLNYMERLITIIDKKMKTLRKKFDGFAKVQWQQWKGSEWTWDP